jgi:hypothetical protein
MLSLGSADSIKFCMCLKIRRKSAEENIERQRNSSALSVAARTLRTLILEHGFIYPHMYNNARGVTKCNNGCPF